jgi:mannose-6-phosphate isomerase-like protein (cupin superfamily)
VVIKIGEPRDADVALGCAGPQPMERAMDAGMPTIIDLNAELGRLTMFRGRTPATTFSDRRGTAAVLTDYRDGILLLAKFEGKSHWEVHSEDELFHILDGTMTVDSVCDDGPPKSVVVEAGMIASIPRGTWHRVRSADGVTALSATIPGDHIELDVDDPRPALAESASMRTTAAAGEIASKPPGLVDLSSELAKLRMFRRSPASTPEERRGSVAGLGAYRDSLLLAIKAAGKDHWERHLTGDELVHVLDGAASLEIVCDDGPPRRFALGTGTVAVIPRGAWHRLLSPEGFTQMAVTPFPGETIERDVDDPRGGREQAGISGLRLHEYEEK